MTEIFCTGKAAKGRVRAGKDDNCQCTLWKNVGSYSVMPLGKNGATGTLALKTQAERNKLH